MAIMKFSDWKRAVFRYGKDIKDLRGGVHRYAAQVSLQIDAATAEKSHFRMETIWFTKTATHSYLETRPAN